MLRNCKYIKSISIKTFSVKANIEFQGENSDNILVYKKKWRSRDRHFRLWFLSIT